VTADERVELVALLDTGISYAAAARQTGMSYSRVYNVARQAGVIATRAEAYRERQLEKERQRQADAARHEALLDAYHRGELVTDGNLAAQVYEALLIKSDVTQGRTPDLEHLDALVWLLKNPETVEASSL
jgi:transposase